MGQAQSQHIIEAIGKVQQNKLKLSMRTTCIAFHNLYIKMCLKLIMSCIENEK